MGEKHSKEKRRYMTTQPLFDEYSQLTSSSSNNSNSNNIKPLNKMGLSNLPGTPSPPQFPIGGTGSGGGGGLIGGAGSDLVAGMYVLERDQENEQQQQQQQQQAAATKLDRAINKNFKQSDINRLPRDTTGSDDLDANLGEINTTLVVNMGRAMATSHGGDSTSRDYSSSEGSSESVLTDMRLVVDDTDDMSTTTASALLASAEARSSDVHELEAEIEHKRALVHDDLEVRIRRNEHILTDCLAKTIAAASAARSSQQQQQQQHPSTTSDEQRTHVSLANTSFDAVSMELRRYRGDNDINIDVDAADATLASMNAQKAELKRQLALLKDMENKQRLKLLEQERQLTVLSMKLEDELIVRDTLKLLDNNKNNKNNCNSNSNSKPVAMPVTEAATPAAAVTTSANDGQYTEITARSKATAPLAPNKHIRHVKATGNDGGGLRSARGATRSFEPNNSSVYFEPIEHYQYVNVSATSSSSKLDQQQQHQPHQQSDQRIEIDAGDIERIMDEINQALMGSNDPAVADKYSIHLIDEEDEDYYVAAAANETNTTTASATADTTFTESSYTQRDETTLDESKLRDLLDDVKHSRGGGGSESSNPLHLSSEDLECIALIIEDQELKEIENGAEKPSSYYLNGLELYPDGLVTHLVNPNLLHEHYEQPAVQTRSVTPTPSPPLQPPPPPPQKQQQQQPQRGGKAAKSPSAHAPRSTQQQQQQAQHKPQQHKQPHSHQETESCGELQRAQSESSLCSSQQLVMVKPKHVSRKASTAAAATATTTASAPSKEQASDEADSGQMTDSALKSKTKQLIHQVLDEMLADYVRSDSNASLQAVSSTALHHQPELIASVAKSIRQHQHQHQHQQSSRPQPRLRDNRTETVTSFQPTLSPTATTASSPQSFISSSKRSERPRAEKQRSPQPRSNPTPAGSSSKSPAPTPTARTPQSKSPDQQQLVPVTPTTRPVSSSSPQATKATTPVNTMVAKQQQLVTTSSPVNRKPFMSPSQSGATIIVYDSNGRQLVKVDPIEPASAGAKATPTTSKKFSFRKLSFRKNSIIKRRDSATSQGAHAGTNNNSSNAGTPTYQTVLQKTREEFKASFLMKAFERKSAKSSQQASQSSLNDAANNLVIN